MQQVCGWLAAAVLGPVIGGALALPCEAGAPDLPLCAPGQLLRRRCAARRPHARPGWRRCMHVCAQRGCSTVAEAACVAGRSCCRAWRPRRCPPPPCCPASCCCARRGPARPPAWARPGARCVAGRSAVASSALSRRTRRAGTAAVRDHNSTLKGVHCKQACLHSHPMLLAQTLCWPREPDDAQWAHSPCRSRTGIREGLLCSRSASRCGRCERPHSSAAWRSGAGWLRPKSPCCC